MCNFVNKLASNEDGLGKLLMYGGRGRTVNFEGELLSGLEVVGGRRGEVVDGMGWVVIEVVDGR